MNETKSNPYKAHCKKCGYAWIKKSETDPKVCPNCNSRKWKEPKIKIPAEPERDDYNGLVRLDKLLYPFMENDNRFCIACPVCKNHSTVFEGIKGSYASFKGDCGHKFSLYFKNKEGEALIILSAEEE